MASSGTGIDRFNIRGSSVDSIAENVRRDPPHRNGFEDRRVVDLIDEFSAATDGNSAESSQDILTRLSALTELVSRLNSASSLTDACRVLADDLAAFLHCDHVIIGLCRNSKGTCALAAVSGSPHVDMKSERSRLAAAALQESIYWRRAS